MKNQMKDKIDSLKTQRGHVLVLVLIFMVIGGILITAVLSYISTGIKIQSGITNSGDELYAADAGIRDALWQIKYNGLNDVTGYNPYDFDTEWTYNLTDNINNIPVTVSTVQNVWLPGDNIDLDTDYPSIGTGELADIIGSGNTQGFVPGDAGYTGGLFIKGTAGNIITAVPMNANYELKISYNGENIEDLKIDQIGIWIPDGFSYVTGSCNLEAATGKTYDLPNSTPVPGTGGKYVVWDYSAYPFNGSTSPGRDALPNYTGSGSSFSATIEFKIIRNAATASGKLPEIVSWVVTDESINFIPFAWDNDVQVYHIRSTAGSTSVEAYTLKSELREMASAIAGDYYASGQSIMEDTNSAPKFREMLLTSSTSDINAIPDNATVAAAYLYWSGWIKNYGNGIFWDQCDYNYLNEKWTKSGNWYVLNSGSGNTYTDEYQGRGGTIAPGLTLTNSLDLSHLTGSATISWDQTVTGTAATPGSVQTVPTGDGDTSGNWTGSSGSETTITHSPSSYTSTAWTNPNGACTNGISAASIMSGSPSGSDIWGDYGFSLNGKTVTAVEVSFDAWDDASTSGTTITRQATADESNTGGFITTPLFSKINDSNDSTSIRGVTNGGGRATFSFNSFAVPTGSTISNVTVHYRVRSNTTGTAAARSSCLKVNGIYYGRGQTTNSYSDPGAASVPASSSSIGDYTFVYTVNPNTGAAWTAADVNGTSSNPLQAFGVCSNDFNPDVNFYQIDISVTYSDSHEQINVEISGDGGDTWQTVATETLTSAETTYGPYDVTNVFGSDYWNADTLDDGYLMVRASAISAGSPATVYLDYLPVSVTYIDTVLWSNVDETSPGDGDYITGSNSSNGNYYALFTFNSADFSTIPADATITNLTVYYRVRDNTSGTNNIRAAIKAGGVRDYTTDPGINPSSTTTFTTNNYAFTENPATGQPWTVADIKGTGANPLQQFGVGSNDLNPAVQVSLVYAQVNYTTSTDKVVLAISNGGAYTDLVSFPSSGHCSYTLEQASGYVGSGADDIKIKIYTSGFNVSTKYVDIDNILITDNTLTNHYDPSVSLDINSNGAETVTIGSSAKDFSWSEVNASGRAGTATAINGNDYFTLTTAPDGYGVQAGDYVGIPGADGWSEDDWYRVTSYASLTINLDRPYTGPTVSGQSYYVFDGYFYACKVDVTNLVKQYSNGADLSDMDNPVFGNGNGTFTVGDVFADTNSVMNPGSLGDGSFAGWSLIIIYASPETRGHQLFIYDPANGYAKALPSGTTIIDTPISGFIVPEQITGEDDTDDVTKLTVFVGEGDLEYNDYVAFIPPGTSTEHKLWDRITCTGNSSTNPANAFNSRFIDESTGSESTKPGVDIDTFHIRWDTGYLSPGDTSATIRMNTGEGYVLVYMIVSFRSETTSGGTISYLIE